MARRTAMSEDYEKEKEGDVGKIKVWGREVVADEVHGLAPGRALPLLCTNSYGDSSTLPFRRLDDKRLRCFWQVTSGRQGDKLKP